MICRLIIRAAKGTTNVLASEVVRHVLNGKNLEVFSQWLEGRVLAGVTLDDLNGALEASWSKLKHKLLDGRRDLTAVLADGREIMFSLAWIVCGALLAHDAQRDANPAALEVAQRWILDGEGAVGEFVLHDVVRPSQARGVNVKERLNWDCRLVWGVDLPKEAATGHRSTNAKPSGAPEQLVAKM